MKKIIFLFVVSAALLSCGNAKEKIKGAGEKVGEGTSEFFSGVAEGVDNTRQCKVELAPSFTAHGISMGKFTVHAPETDAKSNNMVSIYLMFEQDFRGPVTLKVFDPKGLEYGRLNQEIAGTKGQATFFDFIFDPRTDIEPGSRIVVE